MPTTGVVNAQLAHARQTSDLQVEQVVVLGDFGLFDADMHRCFRRDGHRFEVPVSFIEGNHEDFRDFDTLVERYGDVVRHLPRGSLEPMAGRYALCVGGARYMDAWSTPSGCEIKPQDIDRCLALSAGTVDMILSHDCPQGLGVTSEPGLRHLGPPGVPAFDLVLAHHRPRLWFFGHHHRWHDEVRDGTRFLGLPQSWQGYVLLPRDGEPLRVDHEVRLPSRPGWLRWIGLR